MGKAGVNVTLNGFNEYIEKLQNMGHDIDRVVATELNTVGHNVMKDLYIGIKKHKRTGKTQENMIMPKLNKEKQDVFSVETGFYLPKGLPARYIDRGTPTNKKDPFVSRALNKNKIDSYYRQVFESITRG